MPHNGRSLLIVHHEGVGDNVLSVPLLCILSRAFTDYKRYLWLSRGRKALFLGWDAFQLLENGDTEQIATVLSKHHEFVFDLGTSTNHIIDRIPQADLKYDTYVGFTKPKSIPREVAVPRCPGMPMWQQFISLVSALGIASDAGPEFGVQTSDASKSYAEMLLNFRSGLPLICLAPGASCSQLKQWPPEYFAAFIRGLYAKRPCRFVLVGHPLEMKIGDAIRGLVDFKIDNVMGLTTLGCLVYILRQSQLLVANDNGTMHIGGLVGTPTIGLFGPSDPAVFSPLGKSSIVIKSYSGNVADIDPEYVVSVSTELIE